VNTHLRYVVASTPGHYQAVHRFLREEGVEEKQHLAFPTIMAFDADDDLVGVCGTRIVDKMILAGPLMVRTDYRRLFTILRLCEAYEAAMSQIGVSTFILSVEHGSILQRGMERYFPDEKPYATEGNYDYYAWKVRAYGHQRQRAGSISGREGPTEESGRASSAPAPDY
jgi:hypothetical protein